MLYDTNQSQRVHVNGTQWKRTSQQGIAAQAVQQVALYMHVSSEDQKERETIQGQRDFLRTFAQLYQLTVVEEYADDGVSGAIPLQDRPDGRRLLLDATAGRFGCVLVYRVDRLGRSLTALLDAHKGLERCHVTIRSATEPFDTNTPIGKFLFQLLGSLAELEKSTIAERMMLGRDRVAKEGKWTGGPIPFGYDLNDHGRLIPSARMVPGLDITEAEAAAALFTRIAEGSTLLIEARRLNAQGVPSTKRYPPTKRHNGGKVTQGKQWTSGRLSYMVKSPIYTGHHVLKSTNTGAITRPVPALVDAVTWQRAQEQVQRNRNLPKGNQTRLYLLRGLITCAHCGCHYVGSTARRTNGTWAYYRCGGQLSSIRPTLDQRCRAKSVSAPWIEDLVWQDCRQFILHPGKALAEAKRQLQKRLSQRETLVTEQHRLSQQLAEKALERDRVMTLCRRGRATLDDTEHQLEMIERETGELRTLLSAMQAQQDLAHAYEAQYTEATSLLSRLRERLAEIERSNDAQAKRQTIELLVAKIEATTVGTGVKK